MCRTSPGVNESEYAGRLEAATIVNECIFQGFDLEDLMGYNSQNLVVAIQNVSIQSNNKSSVWIQQSTKFDAPMLSGKSRPIANRNRSGSISMPLRSAI
jgi:hypothetical protein